MFYDCENCLKIQEKVKIKSMTYYKNKQVVVVLFVGSVHPDQFCLVFLTTTEMFTVAPLYKLKICYNSECQLLKVTFAPNLAKKLNSSFY